MLQPTFASKKLFFCRLHGGTTATWPQPSQTINNRQKTPTTVKKQDSLSRAILQPSKTVKTNLGYRQKPSNQKPCKLLHKIEPSKTVKSRQEPSRTVKNRQEPSQQILVTVKTVKRGSWNRQNRQKGILEPSKPPLSNLGSNIVKGGWLCNAV